MNINAMEQAGRNLWKFENIYYRLFGRSVTPNGCWIVCPEMREIVDIDTATGKDVEGVDVIEFEACGTVPADFQFITYH